MIGLYSKLYEISCLSINPPHSVAAYTFCTESARANHTSVHTHKRTERHGNVMATSWQRHESPRTCWAKCEILNSAPWRRVEQSCLSSCALAALITCTRPSNRYTYGNISAPSHSAGCAAPVPSDALSAAKSRGFRDNRLAPSSPKPLHTFFVKKNDCVCRCTQSPVTSSLTTHSHRRRPWLTLDALRLPLGSENRGGSFLTASFQGDLGRTTPNMPSTPVSPCRAYYTGLNHYTTLN